MKQEYKELDVTEFKVSKNLVTVKWQDEKGDGKSITSVDVISDEFSEALKNLKEPFAKHLSLPVDRLRVGGVKCRVNDSLEVYYTLSGSIISPEAGVENALNCTLKFNPEDYSDGLTLWSHDDVEKIGRAMTLAGYYAQGDRKCEEPTFFDADYVECEEDEGWGVDFIPQDAGE